MLIKYSEDCRNSKTFGNYVVNSDFFLMHSYFALEKFWYWKIAYACPGKKL